MKASASIRCPSARLWPGWLMTPWSWAVPRRWPVAQGGLVVRETARRGAQAAPGEIPPAARSTTPATTAGDSAGAGRRGLDEAVVRVVMSPLAPAWSDARFLVSAMAKSGRRRRDAGQVRPGWLGGRAASGETADSSPGAEAGTFGPGPARQNPGPAGPGRATVAVRPASLGGSAGNEEGSSVRNSPSESMDPPLPPTPWTGRQGGRDPARPVTVLIVDSVPASPWTGDPIVMMEPGTCSTAPAGPQRR